MGPEEHDLSPEDAARFRTTPHLFCRRGPVWHVSIERRHRKVFETRALPRLGLGVVDLCQPRDSKPDSVLWYQLERTKPAARQACGATKLRLYHGADVEFERFDPARIGTTTDAGLLGHGFYFSTDPAIARTHKYRMVVDVTLRNPLRIQFPRWGASKTTLVNQALGTNVGEGKPLSRAVKQAGYDGVILDYKPVGYRHQEVVVFSPKTIQQVKTEAVATCDATASRPISLDKQVTRRVIAALLRAGRRDLAGVLVQASRDTFDIKAEYQKWNKKIWGGKLPAVPLKWGHLKSVTGKVVVVMGREDDPTTWKIKYLVLSDLLESTRDELSSTLVHEMIHVYLLASGVNENHGPQFRAELNRVQRLVPFPVRLEDDVQGRRVSRKVKAKRVGVALFREGPGVVVYPASKMPDVIDSFILMYRMVKREPRDIVFLESADPELSRYSVRRKAEPRLTYSPIEPDFADRLLSQGRELGVLRDLFAKEMNRSNGRCCGSANPKQSDGHMKQEQTRQVVRALVQAGRKDLAETVAALTPAEQTGIAAIMGRVDQLERITREAKAAVKKFETNPERFRPQLDNLWSNFKALQGMGRSGMKLIDTIRSGR